MNKKAENLSVGGVIIIAIVAIVGLILLVVVAQNVGDVTNTIDVVNDSIPSANGTTLILLSQLDGKRVSSVVVYNGSDDVILESTNYTIFQNQVINGVETALFNATSGPLYQLYDWNISYTYQPTTYDASSGGRAVAGLIVVFFAIGIAVVMLVPTLRSKILESIGR